MEQELWGLCRFYGGWYPHDADAYTKAQLIDDLLTVDFEQHYTTVYKENDWCELEYDYTVRGYCQGDAIQVKDLSTHKVWDKQSLQNLFFDVPLTGSVTVYKDNQAIADIYFDEFLDPYCYWDADEKAKLIEKIGNSCQGEEYQSPLIAFLEQALTTDCVDVAA
ncbi:hypothetical protein ACFBZI_11730 [Moraxella sp. ZJ142]|uniref:hypothetical protein n=1 Tax=Moraxella marmotae TaxID=3344520 RepID=UPI0035D42E3F